jgi:predicted ester cyclase
MPVRNVDRTSGADRATLSKDQIRHLIGLVEDAFNKHEDWRIEEAVGDHFLEHPTTFGGVNFRERAQIVRSMLADPRLEVEELMVAGDLVASRWTLSGKHAGKIMGFEPTGNTITIPGLAVDRIRDGRVVEHWEFPDTATLARELSAAAGKK